MKLLIELHLDEAEFDRPDQQGPIDRAQRGPDPDKVAATLLDVAERYRSGSTRLTMGALYNIHGANGRYLGFAQVRPSRKEEC